MLKRYPLLVLVAALGLVLAAPVAAAPQPQGAIAKKCRKAHQPKRCKKTKAPTPVVIPSPPSPLPLTEVEVGAQINRKAALYCLADVQCNVSDGYGHAYGHGVDETGTLDCSSKSIYSWSCYGFVAHSVGVERFKCDFRESVERDRYDGIKSHQDLSFGSDGWNCLLP
jgi:hypothetical protein